MRILIKKAMLYVFFVFVFLFFACTQDVRSFFVQEGEAVLKPEPVVVIEPEPNPELEVPERRWTIMIYMASDNDLESEAIQDLNELELFDFEKKGISVLCLVDRSIGYDGTNGDWTGTRLYEIRNDTGGENGVIISKELSSQELALEQGFSIELDMANSNTLRSFLQFGFSQYPSEKNALIIWGHGNGWRSITSDSFTQTTMMLPDLNLAIEAGVGNSKLDVLAFDTSFGATIETIWEVQYTADWFAGNCGAVSVSGWNYKEIFTSFTISQMAPIDFVSALKTQKDASVIKMQYISDVKHKFDKLTSLLASNINSQEKQANIKKIFLNDALSYKSATYPTDVFLDIADVSLVVSKNSSIFSHNQNVQNEINTLSTEVQEALEQAIFSADNYEKKHTVSVFFIPFISEGVPNTAFPESYVQGGDIENKISFVQESNGWVPTRTTNPSLLNTLFFTIF